jgi:hypothetical protein
MATTLGGTGRSTSGGELSRDTPPDEARVVRASPGSGEAAVSREAEAIAGVAPGGSEAIASEEMQAALIDAKIGNVVAPLATTWGEGPTGAAVRGAEVPETCETPIGIIGASSNSNRKSKSDEGGEETSEKGNEVSSKVTWREIISLLVERSRQRYPLCSEG